MVMNKGPQRLAFIVEWVDPVSGVTWKYQLFYHVQSKELEMFDIKNKRHFLKRSKFDSISVDDLYLGATVVVFARQLVIVDYADDYTANCLGPRQQRTLGIVNQKAVQQIGQILSMIYQQGIIISNLRMCSLRPSQAEQFQQIRLQYDQESQSLPELSSAPLVVMELVGQDVVEAWQSLTTQIASTCSIQIENLYGSISNQNAFQEIGFFFGQQRHGRALHCGKNSTLGILKPHTIKDRIAGDILQIIQDQYELQGLELFHISKTNAEEFFEVYNGVVSPSEFNGMVEQLTSGPFIAVEIGNKNNQENPVESFRQLCGPSDPEIARVLRPKCLRAVYGTSQCENAIHCTDLEEDGQLEVNYFFEILAGTQ